MSPLWKVLLLFPTLILPTLCLDAQPRAVLTVAPPRETGTFGLPSNPEAEVRKRTPQSHSRRQEQIPFVFCPEDFGVDPKPCSECGGDTKETGKCDNILISGRQPDSCWTIGRCAGYYCKCIHDGPDDPSNEVTSTAVVNGETGTVIWEPKTLTRYASLRASTTVIVTETETTSGGGTGIETVAAVVFAGGVAWWAMEQSGAAAAIAAIQPPADPPEDAKEDDQSCERDPKEKCSDCGGSDDVGLCASGDQAGCPCDDDEEEQECPETPPKCSDTECGGDNGQSQCVAEGKINGCVCCPDAPPSCFDDTCAGDGSQICAADTYKGCGCEAIVDGAIDGGAYPFPGFTYDSMSVTSLAGKIFSTFYSGDSASVPGWSTSTTTSETSTSSTSTTTQAPAPTESLICGKPTTPYVMFNTFGIGPGQDAIDKVCGWKDVGVDLRVHSGIGFRGIGLLYAADGTYEMTDSPTDGNDICSPWAGGCEVQTGGFELYLAVQYDKDPPDQSACAPNQDFDFPSGDECQYIFKTIMNGCNTDTTSDKEGGYLLQSKDFGCVKYSMGAEPWN